MGISRDKKGIELSMNVIIIAIILVIVLVIVVLFFTGGITTAMSKITGIFGSQTIDYNTAQLRCNNFCNQYTSNPNNPSFKSNFCQTKFNVDTNGDGKQDAAYDNCIQLGISCPGIDSCSVA